MWMFLGQLCVHWAEDSLTLCTGEFPLSCGCSFASCVYTELKTALHYVLESFRCHVDVPWPVVCTLNSLTLCTGEFPLSCGCSLASCVYTEQPYIVYWRVSVVMWMFLCQLCVHWAALHCVLESFRCHVDVPWPVVCTLNWRQPYIVYWRVSVVMWMFLGQLCVHWAEDSLTLCTGEVPLSCGCSFASCVYTELKTALHCVLESFRCHVDVPWPVVCTLSSLKLCTGEFPLSCVCSLASCVYTELKTDLHCVLESFRCHVYVPWPVVCTLSWRQTYIVYWRVSVVMWMFLGQLCAHLTEDSLTLCTGEFPLSCGCSFVQLRAHWDEYSLTLCTGEFPLSCGCSLASCVYTELKTDLHCVLESFRCHVDVLLYSCVHTEMNTALHCVLESFRCHVDVPWSVLDVYRNITLGCVAKASSRIDIVPCKSCYCMNKIRGIAVDLTPTFSVMNVNYRSFKIRYIRQYKLRFAMPHYSCILYCIYTSCTTHFKAAEICTSIVIITRIFSTITLNAIDICCAKCISLKSLQN